ncbi:MAG: ATP-binding protein [Eubacteriales bacterium]|nr:ATP-binding protein [Eubacteriales bacterium]
MENKMANSPMWSMEFDEKGDLKDVSWSQAFLESLGIREGEEVPKDIDFWVSRIHPDDRMVVFGAHRSALTGADRYEAEYRIRTDDKGYRWVKSWGEVTKRVDGIPRSYTGAMAFQDEQSGSRWEKREKRSFELALEKAQGEMEKQYEILKALCSDYLVVYRIDLVADAYEVMLQKGDLRGEVTSTVPGKGTYSKAIEDYIQACVHEEDKPYLRRATRKERILRELEDGEKFLIRYRINSSWGTLENFEMHFARSMESADKNIVVMGVRNVDDRLNERVAERMATRRDMEETLEVSKTGLWVIECEEGKNPRLYGDRTMRLLLGVENGSSSDDYYDIWVSRVEEGYLDSCNESLREMLEAGCSEVVYPWNHPTMGKRYIRCGGVLADRSKGGIARLKGYHQDITETVEVRKKQEKLLHRALEEARKANNAKTEFLSHMSHDIRTPINGILGALLISEKHPDDLERQKDCREKIRVSAEHLLSLINDVLDLTRLESGGAPLTMERFSIRDIMESCGTIIKPQAAEKNLTFEMEIGKVEHDSLVGSPLHLRQILLNILGNAVKYNFPGGSIAITLEETAFSKGRGDYRFVISDTGVGMTEEFQKHIFEPFTQEMSSARTYYQGTGLGMAITKKLVDQMDGSISVRSVQGKGSEFTVTIPFAVDAEMEVQEAILEEEKDQPSDISGMHVLLVEDNELNSEIAQCILEDAGATVVTAFDGRQAVETFAASKVGEFDCILMDIMMPVMDGLDAARLIRLQDREDAAAVPIIALSANAFAEDAQKAKEAGMNGHVAKPLDVRILFKAMNEFR